jgi:hypothetical protein
VNQKNVISRRSLLSNIGTLADQNAAAGGQREIWLSFLIYVDSDPSVTMQGTYLGLVLGHLADEIAFVGKKFDVDEVGVSAGASTAPTGAHCQTTNLMMLQITPGAAASDPGTISLWINPPLGTSGLPNPDVTLPSVARLGAVSQLRVTGAAIANYTGSPLPSYNRVLNGYVDEIRLGRSSTDVRPADVKQAYCQIAGHRIEITPRVPGQLANVNVQEWYRARSFARSRVCKDRDFAPGDRTWTTLNTFGIPLLTTGPHTANSTAPGSTAQAEAYVTVSSGAAKITAETFATAGQNVSTVNGCPDRPNRRKHAEAVRSVAVSKVRAVDGGSVLKNTLGNWGGRWRNCVASNRARRPRLLKDPVNLFVTNVGNGQTTRYGLIDITSLVWSTGATSWGETGNPDFPGRVLSNSSGDMNFKATVGSTAMPSNFHGVLEIICRGGRITSLTATGTFNFANALLGPTVNLPGSSNFQIPLPVIEMDLQAPGAPGTTTSILEGGGGTIEDELGPGAIEIGCELATGLGDGFDGEDTSRPQGGRVLEGFPIVAQAIAQEFTVPPGPAVKISEIDLYAFQDGAPGNAALTLGPGTVQIRSGTVTGPLVSSVVVPVEMEWFEVNSAPNTGADNGGRAIMQVSFNDDVGDPAPVMLNPGTYWVVLGVSGDPRFGPISAVPCRHSTGNAYAVDSASGALLGPILDPGDGSHLGFSIDIFAGEPGGPGCLADFNQDGFIDFFDYNDFVACFEGVGTPGCNADFNGDDFVDFFDYEEFVVAFETGC